MTDLSIRPDTPLDHTENHVRHKPNTVFNGRHFGPSRGSLLLVEDPFIEHLHQDLVLYLGTITMENFRGTNAESPNPIFRRTLVQIIVFPMTKVFHVGTHVDLPFQHIRSIIYQDRHVRRLETPMNISTNLPVRRVVTRSIEGLVERTLVDLGNGTDGMSQIIGSLSLVANDARIKTGEREVAIIGSKAWRHDSG